MYKFLFVLTALVAVSVGTPAGPGEYTHKYDNINVDEILKNDRLLNGHIKCLLDQGACSEETKALKDVIPEALENECKKCSDKQEATAEKVLKYLYENKKEDFAKLEEKYDPDNKYRAKYRERAAGQGVKV